jgi:hypothetical protein
MRKNSSTTRENASSWNRTDNAEDSEGAGGGSPKSGKDLDRGHGNGWKESPLAMLRGSPLLGSGVTGN